MKELEEILDFLCKYYDKDIGDSKVKNYIQKLEKYRDEPSLMEKIKERYRPTEIKVNTVGSYLWGCEQNYYGDVNKICSPLCFGSIFHGDTYDKCQYSIWIYSEKDKKLINNLNTSSSKAYIYVPENWEAFTHFDIETLKTSGIFFAAVFYTSYSQHKILIAMTSIDNLPISKQYVDLSRNKKLTDYSYYWIFLLLLFFLFLIIYSKIGLTV